MRFTLILMRVCIQINEKEIVVVGIPRDLIWAVYGCRAHCVSTFNFLCHDMHSMPCSHVQEKRNCLYPIWKGQNIACLMANIAVTIFFYSLLLLQVWINILSIYDKYTQFYKLQCKWKVESFYRKLQILRCWLTHSDPTIH